MTNVAQDIPRMPNRSQRVTEAIRRFESLTDRPGTLLELSTPDLFDIGLLLSDRKISTAEAWRQSNKLLGGSEEEPVVSRSTFYRFADRFKALLGQVTAEHAQRRARLSVANATDDNIRSMTRLSRHRLVELMAEKLVAADDIEDIDKLLSRMSAVLADAERAQHVDEKLELDREQADQRERKLQSDLALSDERARKLQLDNEALERKHRQSIEAAKAATAELASSSKSDGGKLSEADVLAILDRAMKGEL